LVTTRNRNERPDEDEEEQGMKRTTGTLVAMLLVVFLAAGPALAALPLLLGTDQAEQIKGTNNAEEIRGLRAETRSWTAGVGTSSTVTLVWTI
jgi:hypothetical protein